MRLLQCHFLYDTDYAGLIQNESGNQDFKAFKLQLSTWKDEKPIDICKQTKEMSWMSMSALDQCHTVTLRNCIYLRCEMGCKQHINTINTLSHTSNNHGASTKNWSVTHSLSSLGSPCADLYFCIFYQWSKKIQTLNMLIPGNHNIV